MRFEPIDSLVERSLHVSADDPVVFLVGSGVSTVYPSVLPSAWEMISETARIVAPHPAPGRERELARETRGLAVALPEIYYEILRDVLGDEALRAWEVLRFWHEHPELQRLNLGPNSGHLALVYLAWRGRVPIITTNFDTLLEDAARLLGLKPLVSIPNPAGSHGSSRADFSMAKGDSEVAVWKIHGTVEPIHFNSIHTTLQTITRADWTKLDLIRAQFEREGASVCFAGYSGSDLDLFPHMAGWRLHQHVYWLGPSFSSRHMIRRSPDQFTAVVGTSADFAKLFATRTRSADEMAKLLVDRMKASRPDREGGNAREARARYLALIRRHLHTLFQRLLPEADPKRLLIHARALTTIGQNRRAWSHSAQFNQNAAIWPPNAIDPALVCGSLTLKASLAHELSLYVDSEAYSNQARQMARNHGLRAIEVEAIMAGDEALRMQYLPGLMFKERSYLLHPFAWSVVVRFVFHALRLALNRWRGLANRLGQDTIHTEFVYLEHFVRIGAIIQGFLLGYGLENLARILMARWWAAIETRSYDTGYAHGVANARKYEERLRMPSRTAAVLQAGGVYVLLSAQTGKAIAYRDHGRRLAKEGRIEEAVRAYVQAYRAAVVAGNTSLALKALIDRKRIQPEFKPDRPRVESMLRRIQGAAYRRVEVSLVDWLCGTTSERSE